MNFSLFGGERVDREREEWIGSGGYTQNNGAKTRKTLRNFQNWFLFNFF